MVGTLSESLREPELLRYGRVLRRRWRDGLLPLLVILALVVVASVVVVVAVVVMSRRCVNNTRTSPVVPRSSSIDATRSDASGCSGPVTSTTA